MIFSRNLEKIRNIPVIQIEPNRSQPRRCFSKKELEGLSESIKENGILQPLSVRKVFASKFELIAGERRLRAAIMADLRTVPCLIFDCDETQASIFTLLENLQRSELNFFEEAEFIQRLIQNWDINQDIIAKKIGEKQSTIANKLRLLKLSKEQRNKILEANLSERHAIAVLNLDNEQQIDFVLNKIILEKLNIQATDFLVKSLLNEDKNHLEDSLQFLNNAINNAFNAINFSKIKAERYQTETEQYIEYVIKISKNVKENFESA